MSRVIFLSAALCGLSPESCPYCYTLSVCKDSEYFLIHKEQGTKKSHTALRRMRFVISEHNRIRVPLLTVFCAASGTRTRTAAIAKGF